MGNEAHIRADDGLKRGAQHPIRKLKRAKEGQEWTIPPGLDPDMVLLQYFTEGKTSGIAARHGVRRSVLTRWLQAERPSQWKEAQIIRALCTKEDGQEAIYDATSGLALARARALVDSSQWDLERLGAETWAQKSNLTVKNEVVISDPDAGLLQEVSELLRLFKARVIEAEILPQIEEKP